jgi:hypothetical protein
MTFLFIVEELLRTRFIGRGVFTSIILPRNAFGFVLWLAHHQRNTPYRLGQHTNSLVELVETNILFFTGFAFDKLKPTSSRQAYHGQAGQPDRSGSEFYTKLLLIISMHFYWD